MTLPDFAKRSARFGAILLACSCHAAIAAPQDGETPSVSRPVVQGTGRSTSTELNEALMRVARSPRDTGALVDAGRAALRLGDADAALGFFRRADQVSPGNAAIKAQIAGVLVTADKPVEAIGYYDDAERAGGDTGSFAGARGLAYDLVGDNGTAQRWYQVALARNPGDDEVRQRYALSLAIAGDSRAADSVLAPLIQKQDRSAWRVRTFIMAISGKEDEAVSIARATMPADLAQGISPYLRYMSRLTRAQQAAAANFGRFPRAADIGRDDQTVREYALAHPPAAVGAALVPSGEPMGGAASASRTRVSREKRRRPGRGGEEDAARLARGEAPQPPVPVTGKRTAQAELPPVPASAPAPAPTPTPAPAPVRMAQAELPPVTRQTGTPVPAPTPASAPVPALSPAPTQTARTQAVATPGFTSVPQTAKDVPTPTPAPTPAVTPAPAPTPVRTAEAAPAPAPAPSTPSFDLAMIDKPRSAVAPTPAPLQPAPVPATAPAAGGEAAPTNSEPVDFSAAFDSFRPPASEAQHSVAAVDIDKIQPTRGPSPEELRAAARAKAAQEKAEAEARAAKAKADAEAKKQRDLERANPARVWVQVATGANRGWMGQEWSRLSRQAPKAFARHSAYVTPWNRVYRLLAGPFRTEAEARTFLNELSKENVDGFVFTSDAGQVVDRVVVKK